MLNLKEKLQKLLKIVETIETKSWQSEGIKTGLIGYLSSWINSLPDEK